MGAMREVQGTDSGIGIKAHETLAASGALGTSCFLPLRGVADWGTPTMPGGELPARLLACTTLNKSILAVWRVPRGLPAGQYGPMAKWVGL